MNTRDISHSLLACFLPGIRLVAQVLPGGVHQFEGVVAIVAGELAVALDDVAANDHRLNVGGTRPQDHDGDWVAEPVE
jgi:hypothetical protein